MSGFPRMYLRWKLVHPRYMCTYGGWRRVAVRVTQALKRFRRFSRPAMTAVLVMAACGKQLRRGRARRGRVPWASVNASSGSSGVPVAAALRSGGTVRHAGHGHSRTRRRCRTAATDEYRCFLVDPKLTSMAYLTGSQFMPAETGRSSHHAIFFRVDPSDAAQGAQRRRRQPRGRAGPASATPASAGDAGWVGATGHPVPTRPC